jgi:hypothetical protein
MSCDVTGNEATANLEIWLVLILARCRATSPATRQFVALCKYPQTDHYIPTLVYKLKKRQYFAENSDRYIDHRPCGSFDAKLKILKVFRLLDSLWSTLRWLFFRKFFLKTEKLRVLKICTYFESTIGPGQAQARARAGLVFGLSPQARPQACPPGQARKSPSPHCKARARPEPALNRPNPALAQ